VPENTGGQDFRFCPESLGNDAALPFQCLDVTAQEIACPFSTDNTTGTSIGDGSVLLGWPVFHNLEVPLGFGDVGQGWDVLGNTATSSPESSGSLLELPGTASTFIPGPSSNSNTTPTTDRSQYIRQLADLHVQLYEHLQLIPPRSSCPPGQGPASASASGFPPASAKTPYKFPIDTTFRLTQTLIDLIPHLISTSTSTTSPPQHGHDHNPPPSCGEHEEHEDKATTLLILSCANRVLDIHSLIFTHMRACITTLTMNPNPQPQLQSLGAAVLLPPLRIGSFAPPTEVAMAGYMFMVILMAGGLFERLRSVLGAFEYGRVHGHGDVPGREGQGEHGEGVGVEDQHEHGHGHGENSQAWSFESQSQSWGKGSGGRGDYAELARAEVQRRVGVVAGEIGLARKAFLDMPSLRKGTGEVLAMFMAAWADG
jgi:hypothetical protein